MGINWDLGAFSTRKIFGWGKAGGIKRGYIVLEKYDLRVT